MNEDFLFGSLNKWAEVTPEKPLFISEESNVTYSEALEVILNPNFQITETPKVNSIEFALKLIRERQFWVNKLEDFLNYFPVSEQQLVFDYCKENPGEISFSSGSTGKPKAIYIPYLAQEITATSINRDILHDENVNELLVLPLSHSSGLGRLRAAIHRGATIYLMSNPLSPKSLSKTLRIPDTKAMALTPTTWRYIRQVFGETIWQKLSNVVSIEFGSASLYQPEIDELISKLPSTTDLMMHYGLTEASRSFIKDLRLDSDATSIGSPLPHVKTHTKQVPESHLSELVITGPHVATIVSGIPFQSDNHSPIFTGDAVRIDEGRYLLEGRLKEIVNVGGVKVSPGIIESKLASLGLTEPFALSGAKNDLLGEELVLVTTPAGASQFESLLMVVKSRLQSSELPGRIVTIENLPLLKNSKIDRLAIRDLVGN